MGLRLRMKTKGNFCSVYVQENIFVMICVLSQCIVSWIHFYILLHVKKYYFIHFCCLFLKLVKTFSVSSHFNLTWSFSANRWNPTTFFCDLKLFYRFYFTMHNCFSVIFRSLWYWFSTVIVQSRFIVQSCFGSYLAFYMFLFATPIPESKNMCATFQKKGKIFENLRKNVQDLKKLWKMAGDCMR